MNNQTHDPVSGIEIGKEKLIGIEVMTDIMYLTWLRERLINVYGENMNYDFVIRLDEIINKLRRQERDIKHFLSTPFIDNKDTVLL